MHSGGWLATNGGSSVVEDRAPRYARAMSHGRFQNPVEAAGPKLWERSVLLLQDAGAWPDGLER